MQELDGQVALVDVLALEAVRVFMPDVFSQVRSSIEGLTTTSGVSYGGAAEPPHLKAQIDALQEAARDDAHAEVVRSIIERLFPTAQNTSGGSHYGGDWKHQWLRKRRVAHEDVLRLYLERVVGDSFRAFTQGERAWALMADQHALDAYFRSLDMTTLEDVISSLEAYEDEFAPEHVVPGTVVLLNVLRNCRNDAQCSILTRA